MGANTTKKIIRNSNKKLHSKRISKVKKKNGTITIKKGGAEEPSTQNMITKIKENINNIESNINKLNHICKPKEFELIMFENNIKKAERQREIANSEDYSEIKNEGDEKLPKQNINEFIELPNQNMITKIKENINKITSNIKKLNHICKPTEFKYIQFEPVINLENSKNSENLDEPTAYKLGNNSNTGAVESMYHIGNDTQTTDSVENIGDIGVYDEVFNSDKDVNTTPSKNPSENPGEIVLTYEDMGGANIPSEEVIRENEMNEIYDSDVPFYDGPNTNYEPMNFRGMLVPGQEPPYVNINDTKFPLQVIAEKEKEESASLLTDTVQLYDDPYAPKVDRLSKKEGKIPVVLHENTAYIKFQPDIIV